MKQDWKGELIRLASLVGTDAKNPEEKLLNFVQSLLDQKDKEWREKMEGLRVNNFNDEMIIRTKEAEKIGAVYAGWDSWDSCAKTVNHKIDSLLGGK